MRSIRLLAAGASALALVLSACQTGGAPSPTTAPAAAPTTAPAKPTTAAAASPSAATSPAPAASAKPAASPAASPAAAVASPSAAVSAGGPKPTVKVGSFNFDESEILQELYAQILETNGYTIERHPRLGNRELIEPALESGQIDLVPEYLATVEAFIAGKNNTPSKATSDPAATQTALQALASEAPGERLARGGVASGEGVNGFDEFLEAGVVIRLEHFALNNRKVDFDLIEPAGIGWRVHNDDARMACTQLFSGALAAMG